jgi:hypothetical protein
LQKCSSVERKPVSVLLSIFFFGSNINNPLFRFALKKCFVVEEYAVTVILQLQLCNYLANRRKCFKTSSRDFFTEKIILSFIIFIFVNLSPIWHYISSRTGSIIGAQHMPIFVTTTIVILILTEKCLECLDADWISKKIGKYCKALF